MSINVNLDNYNYAADELAKTSNFFNSSISNIERVLGNLDYRVLAYVKEDLYDIDSSKNNKVISRMGSLDKITNKLGVIVFIKGCYYEIRKAYKPK